MTRIWHRAPTWAPVLVLAALAAVVAWWVWPDGEDAPPSSGQGAAPVDIASSGPAFTTVDELAAASDLVVVATVARVDDGRVLTDPTDPDTGIRTSLLRLDVEDTLAGTAPATVVVEHEAALLDGTPITVDGVAPPRSGQRSVLFLVASGDPGVPYHAVVGPQGRYDLRGDDLVAVVADPLAEEVASLSLAGLAGRLAAGS